MLLNTPIWLLGIVVFILLYVALECGFRLSRQRRSEDEKEGSDFLASATLGLLALLLGFTFSLALQRHEERRSLVIAEANALGTSWLRIQAIDRADRERIVEPFQRYAEARLQWSLASDHGDDALAFSKQTQQQQNAIWNAVIAALANGEAVVDNKLILDPLNESFDLAAEREERRTAHLPGSMLAMLLFFMLFTTGLVGWRLGEVGRRMILPSGLTVALLALTVAITLDLDFSRSGTITVSQSAMKKAVGAIMSPTAAAAN